MMARKVIAEQIGELFIALTEKDQIIAELQAALEQERRKAAQPTADDAARAMMESR